MSIIEQERAAFEWWASDEGESPRSVERAGECYKLAQIQSYWMAWQARAALQSQATEAFPCRIIEGDFEAGTVTLEMQGDYTVSSGQKYLCDAPLQSQDRDDAERLDWLEDQAQTSRTGVSIDYVYDAQDGYVNEKGYRFMRHRFIGPLGKTAREAIDHARRIEENNDASS